MPHESHTTLYRLMRRLIGLALGFYFRRIERFQIERAPASGPVLFVSNHPGSLTDSFVIGVSVPRKVNFIGTVQLFQFRPIKWLLIQCGVIPINRVKDNPRAMRSVADTFEAVYQVLERSEAVGIFPEGVTYDDSTLKEVKSGAARIALELENRHQGKLGLRVVPVGLTYSAKELYRSEVLANFGEPIVAADFLQGYAEHRKECITRLTAEIEQRIQSLILHIPKLEETRVVEAVKRLYLDRLLDRAGDRMHPVPSSSSSSSFSSSTRSAVPPWRDAGRESSSRSNVNDPAEKISSHAGAASPSPIGPSTPSALTRLTSSRRSAAKADGGWERAGVRASVSEHDLPAAATELLLTQRIAAAVDHIFRTQPERAAAFITRLNFYERWLARLKISDDALASAPQKRKLVVQSFLWATLAILGAPIALYGWVHRLIPCAVIEWAKQKFTLPDRRKAQASTTAIAAGIVAFGFCYALYIFVFQMFFGWHAALWYALSLPVTGLLAYYYLRELQKLSSALHNSIVLLRAPFATRRLLRMRAALIAEIETADSERQGSRQAAVF